MGNFLTNFQIVNVKIVWKYSVIVEEMGLTEGIFTQVKAAVGMKDTQWRLPSSRMWCLVGW